MTTPIVFRHSFSVTIDPSHFMMRSVICETCGFHIGSFNLHTYRDDPDGAERMMREMHNREAHA